MPIGSSPVDMSKKGGERRRQVGGGPILGWHRGKGRCGDWEKGGERGRKWAYICTFSRKQEYFKGGGRGRKMEPMKRARSVFKGKKGFGGGVWEVAGLSLIGGRIHRLWRRGKKGGRGVTRREKRIEAWKG